MKKNKGTTALWLRKNPLTYLISIAWRYAENDRRKMIVYAVLSAVALLISLLEPLIIGKLMNSVQIAATSSNAEGLIRVLFLCLGAYFALNLIFWIFHGPSRVIERNVAFRIRKNFQMKLFQMVTALPLQWQKDNHSGSTIDRISKATSALSDFCEGSFESIHMFIRFLGCLTILSVFMPMAGFVLTVATVVIIGMVVAFDKVIVKTYETINLRYHHVAEAVHDYVTNIKTVISLRLEEHVAAEVLDRIKQVLPAFKQNIILNEVKWCIASILISLVTIVIPLVYGYHVISSGEVLLAGTFFTLFDYLRRIGEAFYVFCFKYSDLVRQSSNVRAVEPITKDYERLVKDSADASLPTSWKKIEIENLSFTYVDNEEKGYGISDINFTLERGKSYAFIGESGSGKSTTLSLLRALHTADQGIIRCDGEVLPNGLLHVAHHTTLIPQDPEIFSVTIRENITMGLEVNDKTVADAARMAQFDSVVRRLPKGLETSIAEKGVNLSGGEKQRLALARGFIFARESDLILLDEPTSSVDIFNERIIYENVLSVFKDKCIVSTIHKLYLLPLFDEICVFDQGKLIEKGSLDELLARDGKLSKLWNSYHLEMEREIA